MSRPNKRFKKNSKADDEEPKQLIANLLMNKLLDGDDAELNNNKQNKHIYLNQNHIYYRADVSIENIDLLLKLIREYKETVHNIKSDPICTNYTPLPLYIHITTYGGDLYAGFLAYDYIKNSTLDIITVAEGYVASAGTLMTLAGKTRLIQRSAIMMIHQLTTGMYGKYAELEEEFKNSSQDMQRLIKLYQTELSGKMTKAQIKEALEHDYWWDAEECIKKGLCTGLYTSD
jgi:ATP-dependent protease ClpP protease subunit